MYPAIFLDRDGVIIENRPNYIRTWNHVKIIPQALEALVRLQESPYKIVIVTNQSCIGRDIVPLEQAEEINRCLLGEIEKAGGRVDAVFMCPHKPDEGCACRKPQPGMLIQASQELSIDLERSLMIGDALTDLQAGQAAGVRQVALVRTGRGARQEQSPQALGMPPFPVFDTLAQALDHLLASLS